MAHPLTQRHMWGGRGGGGMFHGALPSKTSTPWMVVGMLAAFAGGTLLGMVGGKKAAQSGEGGGMWGMGRHHHHGFGQGACHMRHGSHEMAAPGAVGEKQGERNEGE